MTQPVPQPADIPVGLLLPQQPPFVMIDTLCRFDEREVETVLTVRPDNVFVDADDGCLSVCGMVENMAQTCAARLGYINYIRRETVRLGFIGAVRGCRILRRPHTGETIHTGIRVMEEVMGLTLVWATITDAHGQVLAEGQMKIAVSEKPAQMVQTAQAAPEEHTPKP